MAGAAPEPPPLHCTGTSGHRARGAWSLGTGSAHPGLAWAGSPQARLRGPASRNQSLESGLVRSSPGTAGAGAGAPRVAITAARSKVGLGAGDLLYRGREPRSARGVCHTKGQRGPPASPCRHTGPASASPSPAGRGPRKGREGGRLLCRLVAGGGRPWPGGLSPEWAAGRGGARVHPGSARGPSSAPSAPSDLTTPPHVSAPAWGAGAWHVGGWGAPLSVHALEGQGGVIRATSSGEKQLISSGADSGSRWAGTWARRDGVEERPPHTAPRQLQLLP